MLISSVKRWFGKLFQSLTILTKKEYLKELTLANLVCILYGWLALVFLLLQNFILYSFLRTTIQLLLQRRIPGTQDSRPCRWLLSCRWFLPLAPKCHTNSSFFQIVGMSNKACRPGQRMKRLAWQRRRPLTHDLPELIKPHSFIAVCC